MDKLFNRKIDGTPADEALTVALGGGEASRAIARNYQIDHRVTDERGANWLRDFPFTTDVECFQKANHYYDSRIRDAVQPAFLAPDNQANIVYGGPNPPLLPPNLELVCCLDLTGLHIVLKRLTDDFRLPYFTGIADPYPSSKSEMDAAVYGWHGKRMEGLSEQQKKDHLTAILDGLKIYTLSGNPFHPVWATLRSKFEPYLQQDRPATWPALVGVKKCFDGNRWLALLKYPVSRSLTLFRPTVLDAGTYMYHFPSPPDAPLFRGGHPMNLFAARLCPPRPEYIHQQIIFDADDWWPGWIGSTTALPIRPLVEMRNVHTRVLVGQYGESVRPWAECSS